MKNTLLLLCCLFSLCFFSCADTASDVKSAAKEAKNNVKQVAKDAAKGTKDLAKKASNALSKDGLKVGDTAPDFKLKNIDGKMISLADYKDAKGFIITFTCNHCPYAVMYEDRLVALDKMMAAKGYPVIAINPNDPDVKPDDSFDNMIIRAKEKGFTFPYLFDEGQKVYPQYGATKTPHVFLLDKARTVKYIGAIDDNPQDGAKVEEKFVENAIASLEVGKDPDPNFTKAIGCSIKKKS